MRKLFLTLSLLVLGALAAPINAADLSVKATQVASVQTINWTGGYVGLLIGYGQKNEDTTLSGNDKFSQAILANNLFPSRIGLRPDGFTIGGRLGYDWQFASKFVAGVFADWSYSSMEGNAYAGGNLIGVSYNEKISNVGDLMGRLGYLVTDRALLYVAGGGVWATVKNTVASSGIVPAFGVAASGNSSDTRWGWGIGGGVEYRLDRNWSLDVSYLYADLGTERTLVSMPVGKTVISWNNDQEVKFQRVLLGVNYRF